MSHPLISRSPDLRRLVEEGFEVAVRAGHLVITHVPYLDADRRVQHGTIVSELTLAGDVTTTPSTHVVMFAGGSPHHADGSPLSQILNASSRQDLGAGLVIDHTFSSKPLSPPAYPDYHAKITTYVAIVGGPAASVDPDATARTFLQQAGEEDDTPFMYLDTATDRAGIGAASARLVVGRVGIVGLGGTGSYILDLVAKTPVREIHLFDGDRYLQHNAFRSPGAPSHADLMEAPTKVDWFARTYARMHRGLVPHPVFIDEANSDELGSMDFVFVALDSGVARRAVVGALERHGTPYIDVGMGVQDDHGSLGGLVRVTLGTAEHPASSSGRLPFANADVDDAYGRNIQVADLNALNAALAVVRWKKTLGFYRDLDGEQSSIYTIDGNVIHNDHQG